MWAAALATAALFIRYDGYSSLWDLFSRLQRPEFFFVPAVAVAAVLAGLFAIGTRPRLACGLLLAVGIGLALHFLGVVVAAWRAVGEVGGVRAGGFIGLIGGLLVLVAGAYAYRLQARRDHRALTRKP